MKDGNNDLAEIKAKLSKIEEIDSVMYGIPFITGTTTDTLGLDTGLAYASQVWVSDKMEK